MKICVVDLDGTGYPNLALMRISAYWKKQGGEVKFGYDPLFDQDADKIYASKVFSFGSFADYFPREKTVFGGSGFGLNLKLPTEIEDTEPDYTIYDKYLDGRALGFLTRGCIRKCSFCIVPVKEGNIHAYRDIDTVLQGRKSAILLDNNVLACEHGIRQIERIIKLGVKVDFNQGLDARLIDNTIAKLLRKVKWLSPVRLACDNSNTMKTVQQSVTRLRWYNVTPQKYFVYCLITDDLRESIARIQFLKGIGVDVYAQPFRDQNGTPVSDTAKEIARWVNNKRTFYSYDLDSFLRSRGIKAIQE